MSLSRNMRFLCLAVLLFTKSALPAFAARTSAARLPLVFEPNRGQAPGDVRYLLRGGTLSGEFRSDSIRLTLPAAKGTASAVSMKLIGSRRDAEIVGESVLDGHNNYLLGSDPARWIRMLPTYGKVQYQALYPGIGLVFYGNGSALEHDFEVSPGADPSNIEFRLDGGKKLNLTDAGSLQIELEAGTIAFERPIAYQTFRGQRRSVKASFVLGRDRVVRFKLGHYDKSQKLVIDPVLSYATYLDKLSDDVSAVATDASGNTYITGITSNPSFPVTSGSYDTQCDDCATSLHVFITKMNATGTAQIYSTFLGGSEYSQPFGIAVDAMGDAIVTGTTQATDFPLKNPVSEIVVTDYDHFGFITSLSADGSSLNYSSLLGGGDTYSYGAAVDLSGNAYITGNTDSPNFPVTPGALDKGSAQIPNTIVFVSKFLPSGSLGFSALVGDATPQTDGGGMIGASAIAVDTNGSAYVTGGAGSSWPTTTGAYATQLASAPFRAVFVTKLNPAGSALAYSTFVGQGAAVAIALDANQDAIVAGQADAVDFPVTSNAYQAGSARPPDAFFSKVSSDGSKLLYSSFFVSKSQAPVGNIIDDLALDSAGNIWLSGSTSDEQFPLLNPIEGNIPVDPTFGTIEETSFVAEFDPTGTQLKFATYMGDQYEGGLKIALDSSGRVHAAGATAAPIYTTAGAFIGNATNPTQTVQYTYPYAALIDTSQPGATVCAYPSNLGLTFQSLAPQISELLPLQLINCGNGPLTFSSIGSSVSAFTVPSAGNTCTGTIPAGGSCTLNVQFKPSASQVYSGLLTFSSDATIPTTTIELTGTGDANLPGLLSIAPASVFAGGAALVLQLTGVGFTSSSVVYIKGFVHPSTFNSSTSLSAQVSTSDIAAAGQFAVYVNNPQVPGQLPSGGFSNFLVLTVQPAGPAASLSASTLNFGNVALGLPSPTQTVQLTNSGSTALTIASIAAGGSFSSTNNCNGSLAANSSCTITVTMTPTALGTITGSLTIADNATPATQTVSLSATGIADFTIAPGTGSSTSATVTSGSSATYNLTLSAVPGLTGDMSLTCAGAPANATCTISPSTLSISSGATGSFSVTVSTEATTSAELMKSSAIGLAGMGIVSLLTLPLITRRGRKGWQSFCLAALIAVFISWGLVSCGGGGSAGTTSPVVDKTPPGAYTLTVTATKGAATADQPITLIVN